MLAAGINRAPLRRSLPDRPFALVAARAPALQDLARQKVARIRRRLSHRHQRTAAKFGRRQLAHP